jgi:hypothetical protein
MADLDTLGKFKIGTVVRPRGSYRDIGHVIGFTKIWERVSPKSYDTELRFQVVVQWAKDQYVAEDIVEYDIHKEYPGDLEIVGIEYEAALG